MTTLEQRAEELGRKTWAHMVEEHAKVYTRDWCLGRIPVNEDIISDEYSRDSRLAVIAGLECAYTAKQSMANRGWTSPLFAPHVLAPYEAALRVEREQLESKQ